MKIFTLGSFSGATKEQLNKYSSYKKIILSIFPRAVITTPDDILVYRKKCIKAHPDFSKLQIDKLMVDFDLNKVKESDLIICDISEQSCGAGLELGICKENGIKAIFCFKKGSLVSDMIYGAFNSSVFIEYENFDELKNRLSVALNNKK